MKLTSVLATVLLAVIVQAALARYTVGGQWVFDMVLVGVVYAALRWGAVAGILAGTVGGLLQEVLAGGIVGVGGLSKTLVGYAAGRIGAQFVFVRVRSRALVVAVATLIHRLLIVLIMALIEQHWPGVSAVTLLGEIGFNSVAAIVAFQMTQAVPGLVERGRMSRRSSLSRRRW
jgi:rod shape-determining protein MreD